MREKKPGEAWPWSHGSACRRTPPCPPTGPARAAAPPRWGARSLRTRADRPDLPAPLRLARTRRRGPVEAPRAAARAGAPRAAAPGGPNRGSGLPRRGAAAPSVGCPRPVPALAATERGGRGRRGVTSPRAGAGVRVPPHREREGERKGSRGGVGRAAWDLGREIFFDQPITDRQQQEGPYRCKE